MNYIKNKQGGFLKTIILIVIALLIMRYFNLTISGILAYFNLSIPEILGYFQKALIWLKDLFVSVK